MSRFIYHKQLSLHIHEDLKSTKSYIKKKNTGLTVCVKNFMFCLQLQCKLQTYPSQHLYISLCGGQYDLFSYNMNVQGFAIKIK